MYEFKLEKKYIILFKVAFAISCVMFVMSLALPFLPDENAGENATLIASAMCSVFFGGFSIFCWATLRHLPFADIGIDDDGLWFMHIGKNEGLILWADISTVKERSVLQRLDLFDSDDNKLIRVEYQLLGFELLRDSIIENTVLAIPAPPCEFSKTAFHHPSYWASMVTFSALGLYVGIDGDPLIGFGGMSFVVGMILYEYLFTVTGIEIDRDVLVISYPFTKKRVHFQDVENVSVTDDYVKGNRIPEVWISVKNAEKPFRLKQLGVDSHIILKALKLVLNEQQTKR